MTIVHIIRWFLKEIESRSMEPFKGSTIGVEKNIVYYQQQMKIFCMTFTNNKLNLLNDYIY